MHKVLACSILFFGLTLMLVKPLTYTQSSYLSYSPSKKVWKNLKSTLGLGLFSIPFTFMFYQVAQRENTAYIGVAIGCLFVLVI